MSRQNAEPKPSKRNETNNGLVLRRTATSPGDTIVIRLDPDVPRNELAANVLREGIEIKILDIAESRSGSALEATMGLQASNAIRIDRTENVRNPRDIDDRENFPIIDIGPLPEEDINAMSMAELSAREVEIKSGENALREQLTLLRSDRSKASDYGWRFSTNENNYKWLLIKDEIDAVTNQLAVLKVAWTQVKNTHDVAKARLRNAREITFEKVFYAMAKEILDDDVLAGLQAKAKAESDAEHFPGPKQ